MSNNKTYSRILNDPRHVEYFFKNTLHLDRQALKTKYNKLIGRIVAAELLKESIIGKDTLTCRDHRFLPFTTEVQRKELRGRIYSELVTKKSLPNDDQIKLGRGGALPISPCQREKQAFFVIGLPASGKSEITDILSERYGAIILDSDYAKRKFPEYVEQFGASLVHEESSAVVFGNKNLPNENSVLQYALREGFNIVIPKIGDELEKIYQFSKNLVDLEYEVHLLLVRLDREKATQRAFYRYVKTERYVPLPLIFDVYSNDPTITFYDLYSQRKIFKSYTMISSDVPLGEKKIITLKTQFSPKIYET